MSKQVEVNTSKIDVSECKYKYKDDCYLYEIDCEDYLDCDYKQLQRLKQENEELKMQKKMEMSKCQIECQYYNKKTNKCKIPFYCYNIKFTGLNCNEVDYCYFKRLQQLKQENEELQNCDKTAIYKRARINFDKLKQLEKENTELKNVLRENKNTFNDVCVDALKKEQKLEKIKNLLKENCIGDITKDLYEIKRVASPVDVIKTIWQIIGSEGK